MRKVFFALVLAACGNARIIQMTPAGGIIELQDDRSKAMEQATGQMNQKCGANNFTIVQEGWEPTDPQSAQQEPPPAQPTTDSKPSGMAWRIHFQCNGVGSAQAIGQPPTAPPGMQQPAPPAPPDPTAPAVPGY